MKRTEKKNLLKNIINRLKKPENISTFIARIRTAKNNGIIDASSLDMIEGILSIKEKQARDVMIPKSQMTILRAEAKPEEVIKIITKTGHSRFPLAHADSDKITGIFLAKDLLHTAYNDSVAKLCLQKFARTATIIPESKRLNVLLKEFRKNRNHMAIVIDEYGNTSGLVTLEDVLEEIVGDITDESDSALPNLIIKRSNKLFLVKATTDIDEFNDFFHTNYSNENIETIGGYLLNKFGYVPKRNENLELEGITFTVTKSTPKGILELKVKTETEI